MFDNLRFAHEGAIARLTLNRPQSLNALNRSLLEDLRRAVQRTADDPRVRVVVITGAGDRAFAAGADLHELASMAAVEMRRYAELGQQVFASIEHLGKPVLASLNGVAVGGGCGLAMACTMRIAADTVRLGQPEVNLGLMPGYSGTQRLARLVGRGRALDLLLTGRQIDAAEALRIGLVERVTSRASLDEEVQALASELAGKPPLAVRSILDAVRRGAEMPAAGANAFEASLFGMLGTTADMREGTRAFLDKRVPVFKGE
jgi:enoyl-CoA hydratase